MALPDIQSTTEMITAFFTAVIALATIWLVRSTVRMMRVTVQADLLERLIARWDSSEMCNRRAVLARSLQEKRANHGLGPIPESRIEGVVDFFEEVGTYLTKKLIDQELTWEMFFDCATVYWIVCGKEFAAFVRTDEDRTTYANFEHMIMKMEKMYYQKTSAVKGRPIYTENDIDEFLIAEQQRGPG